MKFPTGDVPAALTKGQRAAIEALETKHGEAYVTVLSWEAFVTFENSTEDDTVFHITPDGEVS